MDILYNAIEFAKKKMSITQPMFDEEGQFVVFLECEDREKLIRFYVGDTNCFRRFGERLRRKKYRPDVIIETSDLYFYFVSDGL